MNINKLKGYFRFLLTSSPEFHDALANWVYYGDSAREDLQDTILMMLDLAIEEMEQGE